MSDRREPIEVVAEKFEEMIAGFLDDYEKELSVNIEQAVKEAANMFANDLRPKVPVSDGDGGSQGHLRDNLKVTKKIVNGRPVYIAHFGKKGWLSVLLEYGWTKRNGKKMERKPFIRPTYDQNEQKYYNHIKEAVERQLNSDD